jgi:hypothetical protein
VSIFLFIIGFSVILDGEWVGGLLNWGTNKFEDLKGLMRTSLAQFEAELNLFYERKKMNNELNLNCFLVKSQMVNIFFLEIDSR